MFVPFNEIPDDSKLWIYISNRILTTLEKETLLGKVEPFLERWRSEGTAFKSSYQFLEDQILIVTGYGDDFSLSGCAMDALMKTVTKWGESLGVDFTTIPKFCYRHQDLIIAGSRKDFKAAVEAGEINDETIVLDNTLLTLGEFKTNFEKKVLDCWHNKVYQKALSKV
ncbi:MAG: hypothetical protein COA79_10910 [Planctomycetota bacterium]|nr:MAG: hypothetical protein COA79_10910 [Planctomycetota bacterium]